MRFSITEIPYAACPSFGPSHIQSRLAAGACEGFPLLGKSAHDRLRPDLLKAQEGALNVVAGQQPSLLLGPLFTVLKAATAIGLARDLSNALTRPVHPLFWIASEDHDILEVNRVMLGGRKIVCRYKGSLRRGQVPQVGDIPLLEER